jgi:hypothetical protein
VIERLNLSALRFLWQEEEVRISRMNQFVPVFGIDIKPCFSYTFPPNQHAIPLPE